MGRLTGAAFADSHGDATERTRPDRRDSAGLAIKVVVGEASVPRLQGDPGLEASQIGPQADMDPVPESQMAGNGPSHVETLRLGELAVVMVRRAPDEHDA